MTPLNPTETLIEQLHAAYCATTKREIPLRWVGNIPGLWQNWIREGFTEDDLRKVVAYRWKGIREGKRNIGCLKIERLIGDTLGFEDDLAEAKSFERIRPRPVPEKVMKFAGEDGYAPPDKEPEPKTTEGVLAKARTPEEMAAWIQELKRKEGLI